MIDSDVIQLRRTIPVLVILPLKSRIAENIENNGSVVDDAMLHKPLIEDEH
jgi:hypothetical protein